MSNGDQWEDKRAQNSTTKESFCTISMFESVQDSDHNSAVRIFVGLFLRAVRFIYYSYIQVATTLLAAGPIRSI